MPFAISFNNEDFTSFSVDLIDSNADNVSDIECRSFGFEFPYPSFPFHLSRSRTVENASDMRSRKSLLFTSSSTASRRLFIITESCKGFSM